MIKMKMFKIVNNERIHEFDLESMSDHMAITDAMEFHRKCGLIGRYYCETESGKCFFVSDFKSNRKYNKRTT